MALTRYRAGNRFENAGTKLGLSQFAKKREGFRIQGLSDNIRSSMAGQSPEVREGPCDAGPVAEFTKDRDGLLVKRCRRHRVVLFPRHVALVIQGPRHPPAIADAAEYREAFVVQVSGGF